MNNTSAIAEATETLRKAALKGNPTAKLLYDAHLEMMRVSRNQPQAFNPDEVSGKIVLVREGDEIKLPPDMSYNEAHEWLKRQEEAEESMVRIMHVIDCFPLDGVIALARAMEETYGFTTATGRGFWGDAQPPTQIEVQTREGLVTAQLGELRPPKWEGGYIEVVIDGPKIQIRGEVKRKFEADIKKMIELAKKNLRKKSIYKGSALNMDLEFMDPDSGIEFDLFHHAPKFMDLGGVNLILNKSTEFDLNTNVFMLIERSKECKENGISLKHGALLKGDYGTGKTMTAKAIADKAVRNGWTFIYLKNAGQLANGLRVAKMYSPAVVFAEDVDTATSERDETMNELLNTLDGVDTKDAPIITILTTNHPEDIDPSFLRAGRIDSVITFGPPEAETAEKFVRVIAGKLLHPEVDVKAAGEALAGLVPAFIDEAVNKAKRHAIFRTGNADITGQIMTEDLLLAAANVRQHSQLLKPKTETYPEKLSSSLHMVLHHDADKVPTVKEIASAVEHRLKR